MLDQTAEIQEPSRFSDTTRSPSWRNTSALTLTREAELKDLWEYTTIPSRVLAEKFNTSKNAIIGIAHRRGWQLRGGSVPTNPKSSDLTLEERRYMPILGAGVRLNKEWRNLLRQCPRPNLDFNSTIFTRLQVLHENLDEVIRDNPIEHVPPPPKKVRAVV